MEFEKWTSLWDDKRGSAKGGDGAFTVDILRSGMPSVEFLRDVVVLDNAKTRPLRLAVERPKVDQTLLENIHTTLVCTWLASKASCAPGCCWWLCQASTKRSSFR